MNLTLSNLGLWSWRLLPGNPILVRVVGGKSKRTRHLWLRFGYLAVLLFVVMIASMASGGQGSNSLSDLARRASATFMWASVTQLALMCVLSPVFTADAITQEKDAQTYSILLTTPLSNAQIVLGSLMSRMFFVVTLLLSGLPIFFVTMIYGGVTTSQIVQSFAIAGATALLTGALAITISMIRVGTRRTIFSFYLMIGTYLFATYGLGRWAATKITEAPINVNQPQLSWVAALNPFLALDVALNRVQAPEVGLVAHYGSIAKYFAAYPHTTYIVLSLLASLLLVVFSMFFVRRGAKAGELTLWTAIRSRFTRRSGGERHRHLRHVWNNPVAWREAATRASVLSRGLLTYVLIGGGLIAAVILLIYALKDPSRGGLTPAEVRAWLSVIIMIEFATILLIAVNTSATAMTKEREANTMDLLLCTPLTSRYIVWGKLRGLVSFTIPLICVPVASVLLIALFTIGSGDSPAYVESALELGGLMVIFTAFACMIGMDRSLKTKKTVQAVMVSVGLLVVLLLAATLIWGKIVTEAGAFGAMLAPFTPFTGIMAITNPTILFDGDPKELAQHVADVRILALLGSALAILVVSLIVAAIYKSMVRDFDMIVRKQSAR